jgi:hypothetical protein
MGLDHPSQPDDAGAQEHRLEDEPEKADIAPPVAHHQFADHEGAKHPRLNLHAPPKSGQREVEAGVRHVHR